MAQVKLQSSKYSDRSLILPIVGEISFDKDGFIEVSQEDALELRKLPELGFLPLEEEEDKIEKVEKVEKITTEPEQEDLPTQEVGLDLQVESVEVEEDNDLRDELMSKTLLELKELTSEYKEETKKFTNKSQYVNFIIEQAK